MPNWCENRITITTDTPEELEEIRLFLVKDNNIFSLNAIVPQPAEVSWCEWSIENWGTKWDTNPEYIDVEELHDTCVRYTFDTAWSPPQAAIQALREAFPALGIEAFYNEPGMQMAGYY